MGTAATDTAPMGPPLPTERRVTSPAQVQAQGVHTATLAAPGHGAWKWPAVLLPVMAFEAADAEETPGTHTEPGGPRAHGGPLAGVQQLGLPFLIPAGPVNHICLQAWVSFLFLHL